MKFYLEKLIIFKKKVIDKKVLFLRSAEKKEEPVYNNLVIISINKFLKVIQMFYTSFPQGSFMPSSLSKECFYD